MHRRAARVQHTCSDLTPPVWLADREDIIDSSGEPDAPDRAARGRREVFRLAEFAADSSNRVLSTWRCLPAAPGVAKPAELLWPELALLSLVLCRLRL